MYAASPRERHRNQSPTPSLTTAFLGLGEQELGFCDAVIASVQPASANDFPSLRLAFEQQVLRASAQYAKGKARARSGHNDRADYHRAWETLVRLAKVRGTSWRRRWDAVRLTLGRGASRSSESEDQGSSDAESSANVKGNLSDDTATARDSRPSAFMSLQSGHALQRATSWHGSQPQTSPSADAAERRKRVSRHDIEDLQSRMAALSAEASSLAGSLRGDREAETASSPMRPFRPSILSSVRVKGTDRHAQQRLRFASSHLGPSFKSKKTTVESASDEDAPLHSSEAGLHISSRRFDEVVARTRMERQSLQIDRQIAEDDATESRARGLMALAEAKYAEGLLTKCLSWWISHARRQIKLRNDAHTFRIQSLTSKAIKGWQASLVKSMVESVDGSKVDILRCKLRAWRAWRRKLEGARRSRREERRMELRGAFKVTRSRLEYRQVRECFQYWRLCHLEARAVSFEYSHLTGKAFAFWAELARREQDLRAILVGFSQEQHGNMLRNVFNAWRSSFEARRSLERMRDQADEWRVKHLKEAMMRHWYQQFERINNMQMRADECVRASDTRLLDGYVHVWLLREREVLLLQSRTKRMKQSIITLWHAKRIKSQQQSELKLIFFETHRSANLLRRQFIEWKETTLQARIVYDVAARCDAHNVTRHIFSHWHAVYLRHRHDSLQAQAFHETQLQTEYLKAWKGNLLKRRLQDFIAQRDASTTSKCINLWKARTVERRRESLAVAKLRSKVERRIREEVLRTWMEQVIERKSLFMEASDARDGKLVSLAWSKWLKACLRHEDLLSLCRIHMDVKRKIHIERVFLFWLQFARIAKDRRQKLEDFLEKRRKEMLGKVMSHWHDAHIEETLRPVELEALMSRQDVTKKAFFKRWLSATKSLPAIKFDHARQRSSAFFHWKDSLPHAQMRNLARDFDEQGLMTKAFIHWLRVAKAKRALRAASRFGAPSALRLRAAHRRSSGSASGGAFGRAGKPARRRSRSSTPGANASEYEGRMAGRQDVFLNDATAFAAADVSSLRDSDFATNMSPLLPARNATRSAIMLDRQTRMQAQQDPGHVPSSSAGRMPATISPPPALRRWIQELFTVTNSNAAGEDVVSEPDRSRATKDEVIRGRHEARLQRPRTPSPSASHTQSEVTVRIRNSPRKASASTSRRQANREEHGDEGEVLASESYLNAVAALRSRRRRQSLQMAKE